MSLINDIPVSEAIAAMDRGENIITIQQKVTKKGKDGKPEAPKRYTGCLFFEAHYKVNVINEDGTITTKECKGDFSYNNFTTTKAPLDPEDKEDKRQEYNKQGPKAPVIQSNLSKAGELGQFLNKLRPQFEAEVRRAATGAVNFFELDGQKIRPIVKTHISKKAAENPGGVIDDPIVYIKSPMGNYPALYPIPSLRNQRKSTFWDFSSRRVVKGKNGKAKQEFDLATYEDKVVDESNLHHYLKYGSVINQGRLNCGSVSLGEAWVSLGVDATWSAVTPSDGTTAEEAEYAGDYVNEEFTPEIEVEVPEIKTPLTVVSKPVVAQPTTVSTVVSNSENPAEAQVVDDLMNDL